MLPECCNNVPPEETFFNCQTAKTFCCVIHRDLEISAVDIQLHSPECEFQSWGLSVWSLHVLPLCARLSSEKFMFPDLEHHIEGFKKSSKVTGETFCPSH